MSRKYGSGCRRKQNPTTRKNGPSSGGGSATSLPLPDMITAGDKTRRVLPYLLNAVSTRPERQMVTAKRIKQVLDGWSYRCTTTSAGREGKTYWGKINYQGKDRLMKVIVSMDDGAIVNAYLDDKATKDWQRNTRNLFNRRCKDGTFEERQ